MKPKKTYWEIFAGLSGPAVITAPENICYLTGFYTTARRPGQLGTTCTVITETKLFFLCPRNWKMEVEKQLNEGGWKESIEILTYGGPKHELAELLVNCLKAAKVSHEIGIEQECLDLELYLAMEAEWPGVKFRNITQILNQERAVKTKDEITALRLSASLAIQTMEYAQCVVRPGIREFEMAAELEYFMRKNGSDGTPFTMKALSGENTVRTINIPGNRAVCEGDMILFDFGAVVNRYASDWTRSFVCGTASSDQLELYRLVWTMERQCINLIKPGVPVKRLMEAALEIAGNHRFGAYFNPYLGHGIGLLSQEWPALTPQSEAILQENMVITIEPGIYIPGIGGVRIEDEVVITKEGVEILTGLEREVFELKAEGC